MSAPRDLEQLLVTPELAELGPGPRLGVQTETGIIRALGEIFPHLRLTNEREQLIQALVLLWHDHWEPAHVIAQAVDNADGALVHGILHRREPDYGNARYWFRRVGAHPVFEPLAERVSPLLEARNEDELRRKLLPDGSWDPYAFMYACEQVATRSAPEALGKVLREIQRLESVTLLEWLSH